MDDGAPVTRLMSTDIHTVTPDATIVDAAATLVAEGIGSLIVVNDANEPVGMFTTTDLAEIVANRRALGDATVGEHMSTTLFTVDPETTVQEAAAKLIEHGIHHLLVSDGDSVVGMLSTMDQTAFVSGTASNDAA